MTTVLLASRRIQPAAFALTLACFAVGYSWLGFDRIEGPWGQLIGVFGIGLSVWLTAGWVANSSRMLRWGLLAASALWGYVAVIALISLTRTPANWLSALAWASLAGGSYFMEERDYAASVGRVGES